METKFTKGKFEIKENSKEVKVYCDHVVIALFDKINTSEEEARANAKLFVNGAELLANLERCVIMLDAAIQAGSINLPIDFLITDSNEAIKNTIN